MAAGPDHQEEGPMRRWMLALGLAAAWLQPSAVADPRIATGPAAQVARASPEQLEQAAERIYIWGFPLVEAARIRLVSTRGVSDNPASLVAPMNRIGNGRILADPNTRIGVGPNNDTLYSLVRMDMNDGPFVFETPEFGTRYYTFSLNAADSSSTDSLGQRTHGHQLPPLFIHAARDHIATPAGMVGVISPTRYFQLAGRILVHGPDDAPAVHALQDRLRLRRYADWANGKDILPPVSPERPLTDPAVAVPADLIFLENLGQVLRDWWSMPGDAPFLALARKLAIGNRGFDPTLLTPAQHAAVARGLAAGMALVLDRSHRLGTEVNGWTINYHGPRFGTDYLLRAAVAKDQIYVAVPEEALYPVARVDAVGRLLDGHHDYTITMKSNALPPVGAFWSVTLYDDHGFMVANPIGRYSIGDRTSGIVRSPDGSVTIAISHHQPTSRAVNWLPAPEGPFYLMMRLYQPKASVLERHWLPPRVIKQN
jgi:hypothetical protein